MIKIKALPSKFIVYGLIVYLLLFFVGPHKYTLYNINGVLYFILCFFMLILGTIFGESKKKIAHKTEKVHIKVSFASEMFINVISIIGIIFFVIYFSYILSIPNIDFDFGMGDIRKLVQTNRPTINKIAEVGMNFGVVAYLITSGIDTFKYKFTKFISLISFLAPAISLLAIGARGKVIITIITFIIIIIVHGKKAIPDSIIGKNASKLILFAFFLFSIVTVMALFTTRGANPDKLSTTLMYSGDIQIRGPYLWLYNFTNGKINGVYNGLFYYTHSLPFFTWIFDISTYSEIFYGAFQFRILGFILNPIGIEFPEYLSIIRSQPFFGYYTTFIQGILLDWGVILTPFIIFITGLIFGLIYKSFSHKKIGYFIYPIVLMMCFISPIYYFWSIGDTDWIFLLYFFTYICISILGIKRIIIYD